MKKTICLLLTALLLCALLGSCGKKTISEVDLTLTVGGTAVRPDTSVSALLDAFGTDYTYSEAVSCVYTGMDKTYAIPTEFSIPTQTAMPTVCWNSTAPQTCRLRRASESAQAGKT